MCVCVSRMCAANHTEILCHIPASVRDVNAMALSGNGSIVLLVESFICAGRGRTNINRVIN